MPFTPSHVPMQYVQPTTTGFYEPNKQQICVPQQMQQLQQRTSVYNQIPQVQPQNVYTVTTNTLLSTYNTPHIFLHYLKGYSLNCKK